MVGLAAMAVPAVQAVQAVLLLRLWAPMAAVAMPVRAATPALREMVVLAASVVAPIPMVRRVVTAAIRAPQVAAALAVRPAMAPAMADRLVPTAPAAPRSRPAATVVLAGPVVRFHATFRLRLFGLQQTRERPLIRRPRLR